jgi:hypothetical protein
MMQTRRRGCARRSAALALLLAVTAACSDDGPGLPSADASGSFRPVVAASTLCKSSGMVRGLFGDVNSDLNDFGRALYDADQSPTIACVDSAAAIMTLKINKTLDGDPSRYGNFCTRTSGCGFNAGAVVALIFAAADRITTRGGMTAALDSALRRVEAGYKFDDRDDGCALQSTDNCMDGHSVAASGFGWIAAYRALRGDNADAARQSTEYHIHQTLLSACLFTRFSTTPGDAVLCKGTPDSLRAGRATTLSLNIGQQYPAYGFGLMTSVAAAVLGYDVSGAPYSFTADERTIALGLFSEAQLTIDAAPNPDAFRNNCPWIGQHPVDRYWRADSLNAPCGGKGGGYQPQMYALNAFYMQYIGSVPNAGPYISAVWDSSAAAFPKEAQPTGFFSWGRFETYGKLGYQWFVDPRPHQPFVDAYTPQGSVEGIDQNRYLTGWACDRDVPGGSVRVTIKATGKTPITQRAALASESGINSQCGGGSAHRFSILVPADWTGLAVSATVADYFGFRSAALVCSGCTVPTTTVEWLQPSGVTWGPANTLTAAGLAKNGRGLVKMEWRDVTFTPNPSWVPVDYQAPPDQYGQWSNTLPSAYYCHNFEVRATYNAVTSRTFYYGGLTAGFCNQSARIIWIQPQTLTGWGTPGALIVAGEAKGAPAGTLVSMWYRNITLNGGWIKKNFDASTDANGIWINDIPNANFNQQYAVYAKYDVTTTPVCNYAGANDITWC